MKAANLPTKENYTVTYSYTMYGHLASGNVLTGTRSPAQGRWPYTAKRPKVVTSIGQRTLIPTHRKTQENPLGTQEHPPICV